MPPEASISGARTRLLAWVTLLSALWLSVCGSHGLVPSQAALDPVWLAVTKAHYRAFALEQGGACQSPVLDRLLDSRVEAKSDHPARALQLPPTGRRGAQRRLSGHRRAGVQDRPARRGLAGGGDDRTGTAEPERAI
jgi:hypothetical protein